jgi:hypothetical protein
VLALAYHCVIHKNRVSEKYLDILTEIDGCLQTVEVMERKLGIFLGEELISPCKDITVGYNRYQGFNHQSPGVIRRLTWYYFRVRRFISVLLR